MRNEESVIVEKNVGNCGCGSNACLGKHWGKCISWSAIIVGALVGLGISFLLNLFGLAIGLSVFTTTKEGMIALAIGGFIAMLIIAVVSMYTAGWVAGYLGKNHGNKHLGILYGFATWCLALLVAVALGSSMHRYVDYQNYTMGRSVVNTSTNPDAPLVSNTDVGRTGTENRAGLDSTKNANSPNQVTTVNTEKAAHLAGMSLFITFIVFLVGALSSSFGGFFGACRRERECGVYPVQDKDRVKKVS